MNKILSLTTFSFHLLLLHDLLLIWLLLASCGLVSGLLLPILRQSSGGFICTRVLEVRLLLVVLLLLLVLSCIVLSLVLL